MILVHVTADLLNINSNCTAFTPGLFFSSTVAEKLCPAAGSLSGTVRASSAPAAPAAGSIPAIMKMLTSHEVILFNPIIISFLNFFLFFAAYLHTVYLCYQKENCYG